MAKKDIPWELFWERYYPEKYFQGVIDMTNIHSNQEYADAMDAFLEPIFAVTFEDIQSLTDEELNCIPTPWLYDWLRCHMGEGEEFIEELREKRELYKKSMQNDQYRKVKEYMKAHTFFTSPEAQEALSLSHEEFLAIAYNLIIEGHIRYQNGQYIVINRL